MLRVFWMFLVCFVVLWLELLLTKLYVIFPAALFVTFYFGITLGMRQGMICGILTGMLAEILLGRSFTGLPMFLFMYVFIKYFRQFGDRTSGINYAISGMAFASLHAAYFLVLENLHFRHGWSLLSGPKAIGLFVGGTVSGLVLIPLLIPLLDFLAEQMGFEKFKYQTGGFLER